MLISDITMRNVTTPFHFTLKPGNTAGRITVSRVTATGVYRTASSVESWANTPFENVVFRDVSIEFEGGGSLQQARRPIKPPGVDARPLPAWGFYARNVKNLSFENVRLSCAKDDLRSVVICDGVERLTLDSFKFRRPAGAADLLVLDNVDQLEVQEVDVPIVQPRCMEMKLASEDASGRFVTGGKYTVSVTVKNGSEEGLVEVKVTAAVETTTRWVWLRPNEKEEVVFKGLTTPAEGSHEVWCGDVKQNLRVEP